MDNKLKFRNKKVIGLTTLASFCITTSLVCMGDEANASMFRTVGRSMASGFRNILGRSTGSNIRVNPNSGLQRPPAVNALNRVNISDGGTSGNGGGLPSNNLASLQQRLNDLEMQRHLEAQRGNSKFNKAVTISGLIASGAVVAGTIGGIIQQSDFIKLSSEQSRLDQMVQEDLNNKRYELQEKEVPEAEQYIIDYYKEHYGIDITQQKS